MNVTPRSLFSNLIPDCKPIATRSRRYSRSDKLFIKQSVKKLHAGDIVEHSTSPWRSQPVVVHGDGEFSKDRMCIDFSQTINIYTLPDAYPLPNISEQVNEIAKFKVFSRLDLNSAYHQIPLLESE